MDIEYTIQYVYGSYSGTYKVRLEEDSEADPIAYMWSVFQAKAYLTLGMATRSAKIVDRRLIRRGDDG